jgi:hypothetical protein
LRSLPKGQEIIVAYAEADSAFKLLRHCSGPNSRRP